MGHHSNMDLGTRRHIRYRMLQAMMLALMMGAFVLSALGPTVLGSMEVGGIALAGVLASLFGFWWAGRHADRRGHGRS